eukprot:gnl/MRDRNA2_/MRDRNA2_79785_c0_seq4.p1 gnl/MRDRNA2_/MRDRNA2_79785_c0~~gnl/MRDRNA2_/MRDRNA2_79785_c0_seq4.p1  ORF type:complete len:456 (+),score=150.24 gnl/MRDRNA2_/MRDRNA2_79785_c0_seq4:163-1368(+)
MGESKASICMALNIKDAAAKTLAGSAQDITHQENADEVEQAMDMYKLALWLLREDEAKFDPTSKDPQLFEVCNDDSARVRRFDCDQTDEQRASKNAAVPSEGPASRGNTAVAQLVKKYQSDLPYAEQAHKLRQILRLNIAACALKKEDWVTTRLACDSVLQHEPSQPKALFRLAQAQEGEGNLKTAVALARAEPKMREARDLLSKLKQKKESQQKAYGGLFAKTSKDGYFYSEMEQKERSKEPAFTANAQAVAAHQQDFDMLRIFQMTKDSQKAVFSKFLTEKEEARQKAYVLGGFSPDMAAELERMNNEGCDVDTIVKELQTLHKKEMKATMESMTDEEREGFEEAQARVKAAHEKLQRCSGTDKEKCLIECQKAGEAAKQELRKVKDAVWSRWQGKWQH